MQRTLQTGLRRVNDLGRVVGHRLQDPRAHRFLEFDELIHGQVSATQPEFHIQTRLLVEV